MINMFSVNMSPIVKEAVCDTLYSGHITQGAKVEEFENALSEYVGTRNVLTVNSGTSALTLAVRLAGVKPGDVVISTPMTCSATNEAILAIGGKIAWADVDPLSGLISPESIASLLLLNPKAIMVVDWGGRPCDIDAIRNVAPGIPIIEDAAHSFLAKYKGNLVGSVSDFTCFSFQAIKHLTTVDGGALTCLDDSAYQRGKLLRWFGIDREAATDFRGSLDIKEWGYKFHMNDVNATIGLANLFNIRAIISRHREIALTYNNHISLPSVPFSPSDSYWFYTVLVEDRDGFKEHMKKRGVEVSQVHVRNDKLTCFKGSDWNRLPGLEYFSERMIALPVRASMTSEDVRHVIESCTSYYE